MFVQFYRSKIRISEMWKFLETIFSICLQFQFPSLLLHSLLPSGKFYLRFWIIILQKMLEWQRRSDKSLSESLGKFVIICTLTLSPGGEICRGTGAAIRYLRFFSSSYFITTVKSVSAAAHNAVPGVLLCSAPPIVAIFPYLLCMGQYSDIFSFQLYSIYPILVFWCCFQYLTGGNFKTAAHQENIVKLKFISSNKVESFVWRCSE